MKFTDTINDWDSWSRVYDSTAAFSPLAEAIFLKEGLNVKENIQNLTPGSNAVFMADNLVIKIFAPAESGFNTEFDYKTELSVMKFAMKNGIAVPEVIAFGEISDRYLFRYIIMKYVTSDVSAADLLAFPPDKKELFVRKLKQITNGLHKPYDNFPKPVDLKNQAERVNRLKGLNPHFVKELIGLADEQELSEKVLVHGDITKDNLLLCSDGSLTLIDFADSLIAPEYYELPAIVFDLFMCDRKLTQEFAGERDKDAFLNDLIKGTALHLFCGFILKDYFKRSGIPIDMVESIDELRDILNKQLFG